jgi:hypothetical protein
MWFVLGTEEVHMGFGWGNLRERSHLEDLGLGGGIILKRIFKIRPIFRALIGCIKYIKTPRNAAGFVNVILLYSGHQHVWATHVALFRVVRTTIQI